LKLESSVVGFTISSRGEVSGKRKPVIREHDDGGGGGGGDEDDEHYLPLQSLRF
jgi:hypothetical protein